MYNIFFLYVKQIAKAAIVVAAFATLTGMCINKSQGRTFVKIHISFLQVTLLFPRRKGCSFWFPCQMLRNHKSGAILACLSQWWIPEVGLTSEIVHPSTSKSFSVSHLACLLSGRTREFYLTGYKMTRGYTFKSFRGCSYNRIPCSNFPVIVGIM